MTMEQVTVKAKDGVDIAVAICGLTEENPKAVIIVCHGFGEHAGMYEDFAGRMRQEGYASVILTQRGHGLLSENPKERKKLQGIIPGYQSFLDDVEAVTAFVKQKFLKMPLVLYGHSMGGNIAANYLLRRNQSDFACAVFEAPWLGLHDEVSALTAMTARLLGGISPNIAIVKPLALGDITGDAAKADAIKSDPLFHNRISLRMFAGIKNGCAYALNNAFRLSIPAFLANAKNEAIVSNKAIAEFAGKCAGTVTSREYESCHAIHSDVKREDYYRDLAEFLDSHLTTNLSVCL